MSNSELFLKLLLQLATIIAVCHACSFLGKKIFGQTNVVCEMAAGIILGPSLLGLFFPSLQSWLFPTKSYMLANGNIIANSSMSILYAISQIGLVLYIFTIGVNIKFKVFKDNFKKAAFITSIGIFLPFLLVIPLVYIIPTDFDLFNPAISNMAKIFFLWIALSVTAFPVIARILEDKGLINTNLATLVLTCGALGDIFAWVMLAIFLAGIHNNFHMVFFSVSCVILFPIFIYFLKKPIQQILFQNNKIYSIRKLSYILTILMLFAWITDFSGIYFIFGAFITGLIIPRDEIFIEKLKASVMPLVNVLFLPVFFVFTGLNTNIGLINTNNSWLIFFTLLFCAIVSKGIGCMFAARFTRHKWQESYAIGALMNTRGLVELIILNIGLEENIITKKLFTILVLITLATALMTSPLLSLIYRNFSKKTLPINASANF